MRVHGLIDLLLGSDSLFLKDDISKRIPLSTAVERLGLRGVWQQRIRWKSGVC
jgi:hypothetical protein